MKLNKILAVLLLAVIATPALSAEAEAASITVLSPNGGENWIQGTAQVIKWTTSGIPATNSVDIKVFQGTIQRAHWITPNDGSFYLTVNPATYPVGTNYKVVIRGTGSNANVVDSSNANFKVSPPVGPPVGVANAKFFSDKETYTQIPIELVQLTLQSSGTAPIWVKQNEPWKIINVATGKTVNLPICIPAGYGVCGPKKLLPGEKITKAWNQRDNLGNLVPPGTYIASAKFYKNDPSSGSPTGFVVVTAPFDIIASVPTNLAPNPGFEIDNNGDGVPDDWFKNIFGGDSSKIAFSWATDFKHSGARSAKIVSTVNTNNKARWMTGRNIPVIPGNSYTFNTFVKTSGVSGNARMCVNFWTSGLALISNACSAGKSGTGDFSSISGSMVAPAGAKYARIEVRIEGVGTVWYDDVVFKAT